MSNKLTTLDLRKCLKNSGCLRKMYLKLLRTYYSAEKFDKSELVRLKRDVFNNRIETFLF